jgi:hypothetical protein
VLRLRKKSHRHRPPPIPLKSNNKAEQPAGLGTFLSEARQLAAVTNVLPIATAVLRSTKLNY